LNRFNKFVLGDDYIKSAARLYPKSKDEAKKRDNEFVLAERVHEAEYENVKTPPEPAHRLVVTLEEDNFTEEKYNVYDNYQKTVHHDPPESRTRTSFTRFLCSSPLRRQNVLTPDGRERRLGSYHQCYRLDGKLVAIGVLDLLPHCVSSVYFLYHESLQKHAPGKLGALYEIALALEGGYRWWYPGFYIHSCAKMRYKIEYTPQYVLDPQVLHWDLLDKAVLDLLDKKKFVSLYMERRRSSSLVPAGSNGEVEQDTQQVDGDEAPAVDSFDEDHRFIFQTTMPGIPSLAFMETLDMDHIALKARHYGPLYETSDLVSWTTTTVSEFPGIRAAVAELVAALGCDLVDKICIDLTKARS
jgi:arginine-tRNA-protein transferase